MKRIVKSVLQISFCMFFIFSCKEKLEKEKIEPNENDSIIVPNTAVPSDFRNIRIGEVNNDLEIEEFAKLLAISLKDKDLRMYLKEEANKQFDGDYDILIG